MKKRLSGDITKMSIAEKSIRNAVGEVEKIGADIKLTEAVVKLGEAQDIIYNYLTMTGLEKQFENLKNAPLDEYYSRICHICKEHWDGKNLKENK